MSFTLKKDKQNEQITSSIIQIQQLCIKNDIDLNQLLYEAKHPFEKFQTFFWSHYKQKIIKQIGQETIFTMISSQGFQEFSLQKILQYLNQNLSQQSKQIKLEYDSIEFKMQKICKSEFFQKIKQVSTFELYDVIENWNLLIYSLMKFLKKNRNDHSKENKNAYPLLLNISHINFQNLKRLNLIQSNILSIQSLAWMRFPALDSLSLCQNFITSLQPFSKCLFQKLKRLALSLNQFLSSQLKNISRMALKCRPANSIQSEQQKATYKKSFRYFKLSNDQINNYYTSSLVDLFKLQAAEIKIIQLKILGCPLNYSVSKKIVKRFNCCKDYCFLGYQW